ncbi:Six-hairpin glycosidase-like protein [Bisporella sp. PMI_857]|nr:Six-hairpin glycosidase-like protein [Bisporella sp. PMI_857]
MKLQNIFQSTFLLITSCATLSTAIGEKYILAPKNRVVSPQSLLASHGNISAATTSSATFAGFNSSITLDFGRNIAGTVQFNVRSLLGSGQYLGFTFTESSMWISPYQSDSGTSAKFDSPLWFEVTAKGNYAAEKKHQRGGFRYMSIWHNSTGTISIDGISVNFTASPEMPDLRAYTGYFESESEKLNRVWYAGAYTNQLCNADPAYGNALGIPGTDWYYNASIANGTSVLMDGAKRDRLVWPGDIIISGPAVFVSTYSLDGIKNGIDSLFVLQQNDGRLPWAGTPFTGPGRFPFSFTYHLYTLLDVYYYYLYSGDLEYVRHYWTQYNLAISWSLATIDSSRMANVTSTNDWLRSGMGGHNIEANAILYYTLDLSVRLAKAVGDESRVGAWTSAMQGIKQAINDRLWDPKSNLYFDNDHNQSETAVRPQDGNSWAVIAGIANDERAAAISTSLKQRWIRPFGAPAPEAGPTISPFVSGFEAQAHYIAGFPERAVDLIEFMWADFMLDDPRMTNSSFIEGYSTNGDLHYAPYDDNDARISHAHGWSSGPTSTLTFFGAGLQVVTALGKTWLIQPKLGGLKHVSAGYKTSLGAFSVDWVQLDQVRVVGHFKTPGNTSGTLILPKGNDNVVVRGPRGIVGSPKVTNQGLVFADLPGGDYIIKF